MISQNYSPIKDASRFLIGDRRGIIHLTTCFWQGELWKASLDKQLAKNDPKLVAQMERPSTMKLTGVMNLMSRRHTSSIEDWR